MTAALCPHNVTTTNLLLAVADAMVVMWCEHPIHRVGSILSSSYYTIRPEILILQWNKAGMPLWKILQLESALALNWNLFAILIVCVFAGDHPAPRQCGHQHQPGSGVPLLVRALWRWSRDDSDDGWRSCSGASAAWSGPRIGTSQSSRELPALPSKWPERYHAVMISGRAVRTPTR